MLAELCTKPGCTLESDLILPVSKGASTPRSLNCGARSRVGWTRSKPSPPVACSLLICSSFCENGVWFTLIPVAFSKFGITSPGNSSDQLSRLISPEDERALRTRPGAATSTAAAPAPAFSRIRRLKRRAARAVRLVSGFVVLIDVSLLAADEGGIVDRIGSVSARSRKLSKSKTSI